MSVIKTAIWLILMLILIYIIVMIIRRNKYSGTVSSASSPSPTITLTTGSSNTINEFTASIWINIQNWDVNYGLKKNIFSTYATTPSASTPPLLTAYLGEYDNSVNIMLDQTPVNPLQVFSTVENEIWTKTYSPIPSRNQKLTVGATYSGITGETNSQWQSCQTSCGSASECVAYSYISNTPGQSSGSTGCYMYNDLTFSNILYDSYGHSGVISGTKQTTNQTTCTVPKIELQKWVNIIISCKNSALDTYIDGKLVKTCLIANVGTQKYAILSPITGFAGKNANFKYWNQYFNPRQIFNIYRKGFSQLDLGLKNLKIVMSVDKGDVTKSSITI